MMYHVSMQKRWHVYMVRCRDGSLYTGITTDIKKRIATHNTGKGAAYTRSRKPVVLIWTRPAKSESLARKREAKIKTWSKQEKEAFILTHQRPSTEHFMIK